jgi:sugar lactone lactonase YvrE
MKSQDRSLNIVPMVVVSVLLLGTAACAPKHASTPAPSDAADADTEHAVDGAMHALPAQAELVAPLDVAKFELPEGMAVRDGIPYIGLAPTSQILRVNPESGTAEPFATLPKPVPNKGFMTGLTFSARDPGALYAALASFTSEVQPGVYRVAASGGAATLFAKHPAMAFPNGLFSDATGRIYVTDSARGSIFRSSARGDEVEEWLHSELLAGDVNHACAKAAGKSAGFAIGANGIAQQDGVFFVTNSDRGTIVKIALNHDGSAQQPELFAGPDCELLGGADGIASDGKSLFVADNYQDRLVRVDAQGHASVLYAGAPLDFPASPSVAGDTLYVTNFALRNAQQGKGAPGLVAIKNAAGK